MNRLRTKLTQDHQELQTLLRCLAEDVEAPRAGTLERTWDAFERRLIRHLEAEEFVLLPLLEADEPERARQARANRLLIRDAMTELGLAIELHAARKPHILRLSRLLQAHAEQQDEALGRLAAGKATVSLVPKFFAALKHSVGFVRRRAKAQNLA